MFGALQQTGRTKSVKKPAKIDERVSCALATNMTYVHDAQLHDVVRVVPVLHMSMVFTKTDAGALGLSPPGAVRILQRADALMVFSSLARRQMSLACCVLMWSWCFLESAA
ncbi:hypothetical protein O4G98_07650 [Zoogloeaceae bacterium G21618-S1]|nr:hypothetical protein [Zoogloeaceae bacterium G21618-S1]